MSSTKPLPLKRAWENCFNSPDCPEDYPKRIQWSEGLETGLKRLSINEVVYKISMDAAEEDRRGSTEDDCKRLRRECVAMVEFLKELESQENELTIQNAILARECISNGWSMELVDPKPPGKKRRATSSKGKSSALKKEQPAPVSNTNEE